ncbi:MAG: sensor histidine kinase, partial [Oscillospiraceae bacterium]
AINYTPEGSEITVSLSRAEELVVFEVRDDGPGISQEDLPYMFDRLYARHSKAYGPRRGFGLGLALCKSIVQAHGGTISIENAKPHGTLVTISIPAKEGKEDAATDSGR